MDSVVEHQRKAHEEAERIEQAIVSLLLTQPKGVSMPVFVCKMKVMTD